MARRRGAAGEQGDCGDAGKESNAAPLAHAVDDERSRRFEQARSSLGGAHVTDPARASTLNGVNVGVRIGPKRPLLLLGALVACQAGEAGAPAPECPSGDCSAPKDGGIEPDLPPTAQIRFRLAGTASDDEYPFDRDHPPPRDPPPRSTVQLSAEGSIDPEGAALGVFWNVQAPEGEYLPLDPEASAFRTAFSPVRIGPHTITLTVLELGGFEQLGQAALVLNVTPEPCADDGVSPPCSDGLAVPGGTFLMGSPDGAGFDNERPRHSATVSSFVLDRYEVTVGRFRRYIDQYGGAGVPAGAGAHPAIPSSGWLPEWDSHLPSSGDDFRFALSECGGTWTDEARANEARPVACVSWFEAFAFCAWDGGRLPTEAEWEYAAAGGAEQRSYPWGEEPPSSELAVFGCRFDGHLGCTDADLPVVGSLGTEGAGRFGQRDLAGSLWEWVLDSSAPYLDTPCIDCANLDAHAGRVFRGGDFKLDDPDALRVGTRYGFEPAFPDQTRGLRCARSALP